MTSTTSRGTARTIVAIFEDRDSAHEAADELHDAGYRNTWIGATQPIGAGKHDPAREGTITGTLDDTAIIGEGGDVWKRIGRFFSGTDYTLAEALRDHGITDPDAARLEDEIPPGSCVLILKLDGKAGSASQDPATLIERCGGRLLSADYGSAGLYGSTPTAGDLTSDEQRRLKLREERLTADKQRVERGVPTYQEELFTERRAGPQDVDADVVRDANWRAGA